MSPLPTLTVDPLYTPTSSPCPDNDSFKPGPHHRESIFFSPRFNFLLHALAFVVLEVAFTILVSLATAHPIHLALPSSISPTEAKGALTFLTLIWHALAIICVKEIILSIFSSEWAIQYQKSGRLVPGETDIVSRVTASLIDQARHFTSTTATLRYRLAFVLLLFLMAVNGLGPSSITINPTIIRHPRNISIASLGGQQDPSQVVGLFDRASLIARLELLDNATYGYQTVGNVLIPWPPRDLITSRDKVTYESDVVTYNCNCSWRQLSSDEIFYVHRVGNPPNFGILPFTRRIGDITVVVLARDSTNKRSFDIDLQGLPTTDLLLNANDTNPNIASGLSCTTQMRTLPATVMLSQGVLQAYPRLGPPVVNNLPQYSTGMVFTMDMMSLMTSNDSSVYDSSLVNSLAKYLFLTAPAPGKEKEPRKPLPLDVINERLNQRLSSAAKGYLGGSGLLGSSRLEMITTATVEEEALALVGSKPFLVAFVVVLGIAISVLIALLILVDAEKLQTFDLRNVKALRLD